MDFAFWSLLFDFQITVNGEVVTSPSAATAAWMMTHPSSPEFDSSFTELVVVHNESEAQGFPDSTIVIWPSDRPQTQMRVDRLNNLVALTAEELPRPQDIWGLGREPIVLEDFGLTYPITIADLVDSWENVIAIWNALMQTERDGFR